MSQNSSARREEKLDDGNLAMLLMMLMSKMEVGQRNVEEMQAVQIDVHVLRRDFGKEIKRVKSKLKTVENKIESV